MTTDPLFSFNPIANSAVTRRDVSPLNSLIRMRLEILTIHGSRLSVLTARLIDDRIAVSHLSPSQHWAHLVTDTQPVGFLHLTHLANLADSLRLNFQAHSLEQNALCNLLPAEPFGFFLEALFLYHVFPQHKQQRDAICFL